MKKKISNPKVFISYAWSTKEYEEKVLSFATRLVNDGIDVLFDKWSLEPGADTINFMEKCVKDSSVNYVLMLLDKKYTEKADSRKGGVGTETQIISNEVYNDVEQNKFIPIIFERDENGEIAVPVYLKSRFHYDFTSDDMEQEYMSLVRYIYGVETYKKPELGKKPSWVDETYESNPLKFKIINSNNSILLLDDLLLDIKKINIDNIKENEKVIEKYKSLTIYRDCLLEYYLKNYNNDSFLDEVLDFYDKLKNWNKNNNGLTSEIWNAYIHETFIYLIAILFKNKKYWIINIIITKSYFINREVETSCAYFYDHKYYTLNDCKNNIDNKNYLSPVGQLWIENVYEPKITKEDFVFADLLIYNLSVLLINTSWFWFPTTYVYDNEFNSSISRFAIKLKSKYELSRYYDLFGTKEVNVIKEKFEIMESYSSDSRERYRYPNSFEHAELMTEFIKPDEIGTIS